MMPHQSAPRVRMDGRDGRRWGTGEVERLGTGRGDAHNARNEVVTYLVPPQKRKREAGGRRRQHRSWQARGPHPLRREGEGVTGACGGLGYLEVLSIHKSLLSLLYTTNCTHLGTTYTWLAVPEFVPWPVSWFQMVNG